jgi:hypothetical protein
MNSFPLLGNRKQAKRKSIGNFPKLRINQGKNQLKISPRNQQLKLVTNSFKLLQTFTSLALIHDQIFQGFLSKFGHCLVKKGVVHQHQIISYQ